MTKLSNTGLLEHEIEKELKSNNTKELTKCPQNGNINDCQNCVYNSDFFYLKGECVGRNTQSSKYKQIIILEPTYSGTNDEIKGYPVYATDQKDNKKIIAVVWDDLSEINNKGVNYNDKDCKKDYYALSVILELLRKLNK